jgi:uncharacterized protein (DUF1330 family)
MASIGPNTDALADMAAANPDEPVVMLNLLRFREVAESGRGVDGMSGRDAYRVYGERFAELGQSHGGAPIWVGEALRSIIGAEQWDMVLLVRYPTRRQFVEMVRDPAYQKIAPIRAAALADSRLVELRQLSGL